MRQLSAELEPARQRRQRPLVQAVHMWAGALIEKLLQNITGCIDREINSGSACL